jgi:hypothetical protein
VTVRLRAVDDDEEEEEEEEEASPDGVDQDRRDLGPVRAR